MVLRAPLEGRRRITGTLTGVGEDEITVELPEVGSVTVPLDRIKKANLKVF